MLQILSRYLHVVKLIIFEFAQAMTELLQICDLRSAIKLLLKLISPFAQFVDVLEHGGLLRNEIFLERTSNMRRQDRLSKLADVCFCGGRQLEVLSIGTWGASDVLR